jgi:NAD(P)-dependent dehydrogenase (short-subunit alcohol dehydrogenase family)
MPSSRWTSVDMPDLSGRTAVVTGASSGLGEVTARELARAGARVVLAVRNKAKGERVAEGMPGAVEVRTLDVGDLASVRSFAAAWTGELDILVNNAGIMAAPEGRTVDGFEPHLGTNYLGPFALTALLLPHITDRVVTVSSFLHEQGRIDLADLNSERRPYRPTRAYNDSKLADLVFALELQRRLTAAGSAVRSFAAHPGLSSTGLLGHSRGPQAWVLSFFGQSVGQGALPTLYAATQDLPGGSYVGPGGFRHLRGYPELATPSKAARDVEVGRRLWELSEQLTAVS